MGTTFGNIDWNVYPVTETFTHSGGVAKVVPPFLGVTTKLVIVSPGSTGVPVPVTFP
jgi:hypothetical protein